MSIYKLFFLACCLSVFLISVGAENKNVTEGDTYEYEMITPKPGCVGGPFTAAAMRPRMPRSRSDLCTRYIRVSKIAERELPDLRRIVFRIDEIDDKGKITFIGRRHMEGVCFMYIDITPKGIVILQKNGDDNSERDDFASIRRPFPFPFICARPPALGFKNGGADGYVAYTGQGIEFVRRKAEESDKSIQIEAVYFDTGEAGKTRWHGNDIDRIRKEKSSVMFCEKQEWENENDWLWTKMERYDANGNIMMRCRKIKIGAIEEDNRPLNLRMTNANDWLTLQDSTNNLIK